VENDFFGTEKIAKILMKMAPPVMLAQLIQALYNVVDSFFVGRYSESGLTALSIIYPIQLLMIALAVGTGVGINTEMAYNLGIGKKKRSDDTAGIGTPLALVMWVLFAGVCFFLMPAYARMNTSSEEVIAMVVSYGRIVCVLSIGLFLESVWTKVHQAEGNMRVPMIAQIVGAYRIGSIPDLRIMRSAENGNRRSCYSYRGGADRSGCDRYERGMSENTEVSGISTSDQTDL